MSEVVVTRVDDTRTGKPEATNARLGDDRLVITLSTQGSTAGENDSRHSVTARATRIAVRAAAIGGLTGALLAGLVNRRRFVPYLPQPRQLASPAERKRYARRTLRSLEHGLR